jgi:hypothetical protein
MDSLLYGLRVLGGVVQARRVKLFDDTGDDLTGVMGGDR